LSDSNPFAGRGFEESEGLLHETAAREVGYDDFGDPFYLEGLRVLLRAYDREAKLNAFGREAALQNIAEQLKKRLRAEKMWKQDPHILEREIRRPIVILGLVRTGSTALQYLMGQDPDMQHLQYWLAANPQQRPPQERWDQNSDYQASVAEIDAMYAADPSLKAIHFMTADGPEECRHLLAQSFTDDSFEVNASIPSFSEWYEAAHLAPSYRRHKKLIQLIGSTDTRKRWLLKYPVHVRQLAALFEVYPDACVVWTHRDPAQVLPSYCSLIAGFRAIHEDGTDPKHMAERQMELWARGMERAIEFRKGRDAGQFFDLYFKDFRVDPIGCVKRIYAHFDQELSAEGERRLLAWQQDNPQYKHGKHGYSDDIGIGRSKILERFGTYMDYFGMKPE